MSKNDDDSEKVRWWPFWLILLFVVSSWFVFVMEWFPWWTEKNGRGTFGDSFGVVNALFSGLAFAGVICAILLQKKELELQRAEIREQKETLQKQNFESSFFQLLNMHSEIVNSMVIRGPTQFETTVHGIVTASGTDHDIADPMEIRSSGRGCFGYLFSKLQNSYENPGNQFWAAWEKNQDEAASQLPGLLNNIYGQLFAEYHSHIGHYFGHLYHAVKFVDRSDQEVVVKEFYIDLIRAQLSSYELGLLFFYGLSDQGAEFKDLVEKYALFENMPSEVFIAAEYRSQIMDDPYMEYIQKLRDLYAPGAYGEMVYNCDSSSSE